MKKPELIVLLFLFFLMPIRIEANEVISKTLQDQVGVLQDTVADLQKTIENQAEIIREQNKRIDALEGKKQLGAKEADQDKLKNLQKRLEQLETGSRNTLTGKWNPDIGVVVDTVFKLDSGTEDAEGADRVSAREIEIVFGSNVDPYSRLDVTASFSDFEDASIEEAYLTHFGLPYDIKARFGKFKPKIGKTIPVHRDSLNTVDEPRVIEKYFGVEGYNKAGVDMTKIIDVPWEATHELTLGVLEGGNGEEGTAFGSTRRRPTIYSHFKNYVDLSDMTGFELGFSHLIGSRDADSSFEVNVLGVDATLVHNISANKKMKLQGELFNLDRDETTVGNDNLWGGYGILDLRLDQHWDGGFRYDYVEPVDNPAKNPGDYDQAFTGYVTFYQSEFARWRVQYTHVDLASSEDDNQVMIQGVFAIGEHKHKIQ